MMAAVTARLKKYTFVCAMAVLLLQAACSAQTPATSSSSPPGSALALATATQSASSSGLLAGEYITEKGWGHLRISDQQGGLIFSIASVTGEDMCALDGVIRNGQGVVANDTGPSTCIVDFVEDDSGIDVSARTPAQCKHFCGYNGEFEAKYLDVKAGCGRSAIQQTRDSFKLLYDSKNYKSALEALSPVLAECLPTLDWEEEGGIRNDLAIAQYKSGLHEQCLATLEPYAEDAGKDDDAVVDGWPPALADRYLSIVKAARTNMALCSRNIESPSSGSFSGTWNYEEKCGFGHFVTISFKQSGDPISGTWSEGTIVKGSDGQFAGKLRGNRLYVRYCGHDEASGYSLCPEFDAESDYFIHVGDSLIRFRMFGTAYREDISLHRQTSRNSERIDESACGDEAGWNAIR